MQRLQNKLDVSHLKIQLLLLLFPNVQKDNCFFFAHFSSNTKKQHVTCIDDNFFIHAISMRNLELRKANVKSMKVDLAITFGHSRKISKIIKKHLSYANIGLECHKTYFLFCGRLHG